MELNKDVQDGGKAALSWMRFPRQLSKEGVILGSESLFGSSVFSGLLCVADAVADSADEYRKARSPIKAKFSKVFQPSFWFYAYLLHSLPCSAISGTGSPSTNRDCLGMNRLLFSSCFFCRDATLKIIV